MADSSDKSLSANCRHYDRLLSEPWYSSCEKAACWTHFVSPSHRSLHILLLNSVLIPLNTPSDLIHELVKTRMLRLQAEAKGIDRLWNKMSKKFFSPYLSMIAKMRYLYQLASHESRLCSHYTVFTVRRRIYGNWPRLFSRSEWASVHLFHIRRVKRAFWLVNGRIHTRDGLSVWDGLSVG